MSKGKASPVPAESPMKITVLDVKPKSRQPSNEFTKFVDKTTQHMGIRLQSGTRCLDRAKNVISEETRRLLLSSVIGADQVDLVTQKFDDMVVSLKH